MRAVVIEGGELRVRERAVAVPDALQVLVRVHATAVNRADLMQVRGLYPAPAGVVADIPGLEYAGVVERVGADVTRWRAGDRVMGLVGGGAYAEYVVVHEAEAVAVPASLSLEQAAAVPEAFMTAHDALFTQAALRAGEHVLIHAAASGVGTAAVQLARAAGARVTGTVRTPEKLERVRAFGADVALRADQEWPRDVDVVLDLVGGDYLGRNVQALAPRGRLMIVGLVAGRSAPLEMGDVLRKRLHIIGTAMRSRALDEKIAVAQAFAADVLPLLERGAVAPVIDRVLDAGAAADAHALLAGNGTVGKVVLRW